MSTSHLDYLPKDTVVHKTRNQSIVQDDAPSGKRTTHCEKQVPSMEVHNNWKYVTCKYCLKDRN